MVVVVEVFIFLLTIAWIICIPIEILIFKYKPKDDSKQSFNINELYGALKNLLNIQSENIISVLGIMNAQEYQKNNNRKHGFCVLTEKAVYFMGKVYNKKGKFFSKTETQQRYVITDIKGIKVSEMFRRNVFFICIAALILLFTAIALLTAIGINYDEWGGSDCDGYVAVLVVAGTAILAVLIWFVWVLFSVKDTLVSLEMNGLEIGLPVNTLGKQEIKDFYKSIKNVQNEIVESRALDVQNSEAYSSINETKESTGKEEQTSKSDKISKLTELSNLYEKGIIQQEEFEQLKNEVMQN